MRIPKLLILIGLFSTAQLSHAASFDCAKAATQTEKVICSDPVLSRLDEQLADAYRVAQKRAASRVALRKAQRNWLDSQRDVCRDAACLRGAYETRINTLLDESNGNPSSETLEVNAINAREPYAAPNGVCDGFPKLAIGMAKGMCAGLVVGPTQGDSSRRIRMPRGLLELTPTTWLVSDLGAWAGSKGAVWRLRLGPDGGVAIEPLLEGLRLPHTLAKGPDGLIYVSEMGRIFRFDPDASDPSATAETVVGNLPDNRLHENRHPIAAFIFDQDGAMLVNVGAPSDQCLSKSGKPSGPTCDESEQRDMAASIRRYALSGSATWDQTYVVHARGLRNSMALVRHASGTILQGENSYDFEARLEPFEEVNVIQAGKHYGWPYCYDNDKPTPGWKGMSVTTCGKKARYSAPALLLPPHSSPLAFTYYRGAMFPELEGNLLVTLHGFRSVGGRVMAFETDDRGVPLKHPGASFPAYGSARLPYGSPNAADGSVLTPAWNKVVGLRPQGSPTGITVATDGSIWVTDDRAGVVIRIARASN